MCPDFDAEPLIDKGVLFVNGVCASTDDRFLWDYTQALLSVDGRIASSGAISSSSQVDGSFLGLLALGTGSFNFTPPSGYGGILYRGGSTFYYWNDLDLRWEVLDFAGHVSNTVSVLAGPGLIGGGPLTGDVTLSLDPNYELIDILHNGVLVGKKSFLNYQDSVSVSWSINSNGNITISAFGTGGGAWIADVNANNFSIINLNSINGIPVNLFLTNPFNRNVGGNNFDLTGIGNESINNNLTVGGTIFYHGVPLEDFMSSGGLWGLNADGSIFRNSNVFITGSETPLTVASTNNHNYLYLTATGSSEFAAIATKFNNVYGGEIGWDGSVVELWTAQHLILRGYDNDGHMFISGPVSIGKSSAAFPLDVVGVVNSSSCFYISGAAFACNDGAGGISLSRISSITAVGTLSFSGNLNVSGFVNANSYFVQGVLFAQSNGAGGINLSNVTNINGAPPITSYVASLNGLVGNVGISAGSNITITPSGQTLIISSTATGGSGYAGVTNMFNAIGSKVVNTTYTNSHGLPMFVSISGGLVASQTLSLVVNGVQVSQMHNNVAEQNVGSISGWVLPGQQYVASDLGAGSNIYSWVEWW